MSKEEKNLLLYEFNNSIEDYEKDKTVQELFELQVQKTPDNIALVFKDTTITYRELNSKANNLARILRNKGVQPEVIVGIMLNRSVEMMIAILAVLKSGQRIYQ